MSSTVLMTNENWWEEKRHEVFGFIEDEHSCCIKPEHSIEYSQWLASEAERRGYQRAMREARAAERTMLVPEQTFNKMLVAGWIDKLGNPTQDFPAFIPMIPNPPPRFFKTRYL